MLSLKEENILRFLKVLIIGLCNNFSANCWLLEVLPLSVCIANLFAHQKIYK